MKHLLILLGLALMLPVAVSAQGIQVNFDYDAAGNRTDRWIELVKLKSSDSLLTDPALYHVLAGLDEQHITEDTENRKTRVYPNPVGRVLKVAPGSGADALCRYRLVDSNGRRLLEAETDQSPFEVDMQAFQAGTYYLHLQSGTLNQLFKLIKN